MDDVCGDTETERFFFNPQIRDCEAFTDMGCNLDMGNSFNSYATCRSACGRV